MRNQELLPLAVAPRLLPLAAAWLLAASAIGDETAGPVLHLADGGYLAGELVGSPEAGSIRWQGSAFADPLDFPSRDVDSIRWPLPATPPEPPGDAFVELTGGDVLFGTLVELDDEALTLDTERFGRLRVSRDRLRAIHRRRDASDLVYFGPNGLAGWEASPDAGAWEAPTGQPATKAPGAALDADVGLPTRAVVEFELSWLRKPDFVLALGTSGEPTRPEPPAVPGQPVPPPGQRGGDRPPAPPGLRFEVWAGKLVALRETGRRADLAAIDTLPDGPGHLSLRAYLDQERGRFIVEATDGRRVADLAVPDDDDRPIRPGVRLENVRGDVRLERLVVRGWDGELPPEVPSGRPTLVRDDGSLVTGSVERFDAETAAFSVRTDDGEVVVPFDRVAALAFGSPGEAPGREVGLSYHDGTRLGGALGTTGPESLAMEAPGIEGPVEAPVDGLRSMVVFDRAGSATAGGAPIGLLELDGTRLRGRLADAEAGPDAGCLAWHPLCAAAAARLRPGISGRIVYKEEAPTPDAPPDSIERRGFIVRDIRGMEAIEANVRTAPSSVVEANLPRLLYLRSGDIVPAELTAIDEHRVRFRSPLSENATVAHERVKSARLAPSALDTLTEAERERLLTLPRLQQANPPTHLIRSRNGDFLRGRLLGLDDEALRIEVRLAERRIPRELVAEIIWLHPEDDREAEEEAEGEDDAAAGGAGTAEAGADDDTPSGPGSMRVQALRSDGVRLTFTPERVEDSTLIGTSEVLGACRVPLGEVDRILIGGAIEAALTEQEAHRWALRDAEIPRAFQEDAGSGGTAGTESAMVGRVAPDFTLDLLDGESFTLADHRGEVVILDFWATWCGPCLQAMPQVEEVAAEFRDRGVRLVAVNLQESPDVIRPMLERHRFDLTVALDRDGVAAARYGVAAIPQTVVIDRDGTVARLFVGGGSRLGDQLREALEGLIGGRDAQPGE